MTTVLKPLFDQSGKDIDPTLAKLVEQLRQPRVYQAQYFNLDSINRVTAGATTTTVPADEWWLIVGAGSAPHNEIGAQSSVVIQNFANQNITFLTSSGTASAASSAQFSGEYLVKSGQRVLVQGVSFVSFYRLYNKEQYIVYPKQKN